MSFLRAMRKLILGETTALPIGVAVAVAITAGARVIEGPHGWFGDAGGFLLAVLLVIALAFALPRRD